MKVRRWTSIILVLLLLLSLTACGANSGGAAMDNYAPESGSASFGKEESGTTAPLVEDRKLIRTLNIRAETEDLDALLETITQRVTELGGYIQERNLQNGSAYAQRRYRSVSMVIRIPADQADNFVQQISGESNIVSSSETVQDVTLQYVDVESRIQALETERDRLMELLEQAESLEDILMIEQRLTEVRYSLESYTSQMRTLENQISYATIHLNISEVQEYTPVAEKTVWQRITGGFKDSLEGIGDGAVELMIWVLANSPYLVLYGAVLFLVTRFLRKRRKNRRVKKETPKNEQQETE